MKMIGRISTWLVLGSVGIVFSGVSTQAAHAQMCTLSPDLSSPTESGKDASTLPFVACNGQVGFRTSELAEDDSDLNLDGDTNDFVFQVLDLDTSLITNVGIDGSGVLACGGDYFAFGVSEAREDNHNLNGDFDSTDFVLHVYDASADSIDNVGLAVTQVVVSDSLVAFTVPESGEGVDLNGDLDLLDQVLHVYDPATTVTTNVGQATIGALQINGHVVAFLTPEGGQGQILNNDGDTSDNVVQVYDAALSVLTNTMQHADDAILFDGDVVAFRTNERRQGIGTLNGDNDLRDSVPQVYCVTGATCATAGVTQTVPIAALNSLALSGDYLAFVSRERDQGVDMNADNDRRDHVLHVYRISTGTVTSSSLASTARTPAISGNYVAFLVPERAQARTDLNGDGDTNDAVYHVYDASSSSATNTLRGTHPGERRFQASGDYLAFVTTERNNGRTDATGDGDARDVLVELWQLSSAGPSQCGEIAADRSTSINLADGKVVFRASERDTGDDLNGDLAMNDKVVAILDGVGNSIEVLDIEALHVGNQQDFLIEDGHIVYRAREATVFLDLNNDGDTEDNVLMQYP